MKKNYFLITLSICLTTTTSDQDKTPIDTNSSLGLTPMSPNSTIASPVRALPKTISTVSVDHFMANKSPEEMYKSLQNELRIAQDNHQKLIERLKKERNNFFKGQENERINTTFSRWEILKNKPKDFEAKQKKASELFLDFIKQETEKSQAYELECLKNFQDYALSQKPSNFSKKIKAQQEAEIDDLIERHMDEKYAISKTPDWSAREKLLNFWAGK